MSRCRFAVLCAVLIAQPAVAQRPGTGALAGRIVGEGGQPLPYSIVALPELGRERFTDDSGAFLIPDLPAGRTLVRVRRLGFAPFDVTVPVRAGHTDTVRMTLQRIAVRLATVEVREHPPCRNPGAPDPTKDSTLALVYAQLRLNAQQFRTLSDAYPFAYDMEVKRSRTLVSGRDLEDGTEIERTDSRHAWRYKPGDVVTRMPYRAGRTRRYGPLVFNIPTLPDFVEESFVRNHCFHNGGIVQVDDSTLIRMDVVAAEKLRSPDVDGSIFLDPETFQIRRTVMRMSRMPSAREVQGMTGLEVTTHFHEVLPSIPIIRQVRSTQRFDPRTRGLTHFAAFEQQVLVGFAFLQGRPGEQKQAPPPVRERDRFR